jgi:oligosaccharide repeat unit polymerase
MAISTELPGMSAVKHKASVIGVKVAGVLGVLFMAIMVASWLGPAAIREVGWALSAIALIALCVRPVVRTVQWLSRRDLFSPLIAFPLTYTIWFALGSLTLDTGASKVLAYSAAGLACYVAAILLTRKLSVGQSAKPLIFPAIINDWTHSRLWFAIGVLSLLTMVSYAYIISKVGIVALDPDAAEARMGLIEYGPVEAVLFTAAWTVLLFTAAQLWTGSASKARRRLAWLGLIPLAILLLSLGSRGYFFVPLLTAVIARHYLRKRFHIATLIPFALVVFMALSLYGYTRDQTLSTVGSSLSSNKATELAIFPLIYAYLYVSQPIETLHEVMRVIPRTIPYQNGLLTFDALRTLLPGHHEMSDMFFKQILGSDFVGGGQPATLLGPLYADFGPAGILIGMFVTGIIVAKAYSWMQAQPRVLRVLIYAWVMQTLLFALFGALIPYVTTLWIPLFWWILDSAWLRKPRFAVTVPAPVQTAEAHL